MGLTRSLRELGALGTASYAATRAAARLPGLTWRRYRLVAVPVATMPAMPRGHAVRELTEAEIRAAAGALDLPGAAIDHRLGQGLACLAAWRDGRLLGVNWVTAAPFVEDEAPLRFVPPPGAAWDTGLHVLPAERGGRAFAALWAGTADWLRARGLGWSCSRITDYNVASWRSHVRMGGRDVGRVAMLRLGSRRFMIGSDGGVALTKAGGEPATCTLKLPA